MTCWCRSSAISKPCRVSSTTSVRRWTWSSDMKKWFLIAFLAFAAMIAWVGAGPFRTMDAIGRAVERGDTAELSRHVDFPAVRASIRAQFDDYLVRRAGADAQASP